MPSEFERSVLPHLDAAYNLARWLVHDPDLARDVVQDAMVRALRYHAGLRGSAKPWLLQIVRNVAYDCLAARRTRSIAELPADAAGLSDMIQETIPDPGADPLSTLERKDGLRHLDDRLAMLPDELRECLVLRELEELSYKEIAEITGAPIGTVMSRLWRARRALLGTAS